MGRLPQPWTAVSLSTSAHGYPYRVMQCCCLLNLQGLVARSCLRVRRTTQLFGRNSARLQLHNGPRRYRRPSRLLSRSPASGRLPSKPVRFSLPCCGRLQLLAHLEASGAWLAAVARLTALPNVSGGGNWLRRGGLPIVTGCRRGSPSYLWKLLRPRYSRPRAHACFVPLNASRPSVWSPARARAFCGRQELAPQSLMRPQHLEDLQVLPAVTRPATLLQYQRRFVHRCISLPGPEHQGAWD